MDNDLDQELQELFGEIPKAIHFDENLYHSDLSFILSSI